MEEHNYNQRRKYSSGSSLGKSKWALEKALFDIDFRLESLEERVFANDKKIVTNLPQQLLLLYHLGILDKFNELDLTPTKRNKLLSLILNASEINIKKALQRINFSDSDLKTRKNYKFLTETFSRLKMEPQELATERILDEIINKENKKSKK